MYECSIIKCSHNNNGICLAQCDKECSDYPIVEYLATDQLRNANICSKYSKDNCKGCPEANWCPNYYSYEEWLINNYISKEVNDNEE